MDQFEKDQIQKAFKRCYGLKTMILSGNADAVKELAMQAGMRSVFIIEHLEEIKKL